MLLRLKPHEGESEAGHWLRLAFAHGVSNPLHMPEAKRPARINARVKLCPVCLSRKLARWQERWNESSLWCECHDVWLVDRCANCNRRWTWPVVRFDCCACGAAHVQQPVQNLPHGLSRCIQSGDWRFETLRWFGALASDGLHSRPAKKASSHDMLVIAAQATRGLALVQHWPDGWFRLLDELRASSKTAEGPRYFNAEWPGLLAKIRGLRDAPDRERIRAAIEVFVLASRSSSSPIIGRNVTPAPTLRSLAKHAGMGLRRLTAALKEERTPIHRVQVRSQRVVAMPDRVLRAENLRRQSMSRTAAARTLGLSRVRIEQLLDGVLRETPHGIDRASVQSLLASVKRVGFDESAAETHCRVGEAMRLLIPNRVTKGFIAALQRGELGSLGGHSSTALGELLVDRATVRRWWMKQPEPSSTLLTMRDAATELHVKDEVLAHLVSAGLIETVSQRCGRRMARFVRLDDLLEFKARHCKLKELADASAVPVRLAYRWASEKGFAVVTGPLVDGGRQYFVRRPEPEPVHAAC